MHAKGSSDSTGTSPECCHQPELHCPVGPQDSALPRSLIPPCAPWNCSQSGIPGQRTTLRQTPKSSKGAGKGGAELRASATKGGCEIGGAVAQRGEIPSPAPFPRQHQLGNVYQAHHFPDFSDSLGRRSDQGWYHPESSYFIIQKINKRSQVIFNTKRYPACYRFDFISST